VVDSQEVENRYSQVKNAFTQLDQLLTQAATAKIVQAAEKVAVDNGYDLVLRTANVIVYRNTARLEKSNAHWRRFFRRVSQGRCSYRCIN